MHPKLGLADLVDAGARAAYQRAIAVLPAEHIEAPAARLGLATAALAAGDRAAAATALAGLHDHAAVRASPGLQARRKALAARGR